MLNALVWGHSDQKGGIELSCLGAKALIAETNSDLIGIVTPDRSFVTNFFRYE